MSRSSFGRPPKFGRRPSKFGQRSFGRRSFGRRSFGRQPGRPGPGAGAATETTTEIAPRLPAAIRVLRWSVVILVVAGAAACMSRGANQPADPALVDPTTGVAPDLGSRRPLAGFGEIGFLIRNGSVVVEDLCAMLADDPASRSIGLMNQTDMRGYDAMIFRFESDTDGAFFMKDTPMPLSIAWFDADSRFVASTDMEPCLGEDSCTLYRPPRPYRLAVEVPQGRLADLAIGPDAVIEGGGRCN